MNLESSGRSAQSQKLDLHELIPTLIVQVEAGAFSRTKSDI